MLKVQSIALNVLQMKTRMPFKYGIATLTEIPHLFVRLELDVDGARSFGISSDGLPPKWFTKNPQTLFRDDLKDMLAVIRSACELAKSAAPAETVFALWEQIYKSQSAWAGPKGHPPLLWNFGASLVERALIDAFCRAKATTLAQAVRANSLGIDLGRMRSELSGRAPAGLLPPAPLRAVYLRHTVGLADPLTAGDIPPAERTADGLPQSLDENIQAYGLTHFKIKLCGDAQKDFTRLHQLAKVFTQHAPESVYTLDGNEQYKSVDAFRTFWQSLKANTALGDMLKRCLFVEQPLHRDTALSDETADAMRAWHDRPPTIIDESDADLWSLPRALDGGYVGTSHKNCKGIFKGVANACLLEKRRRENPGSTFVLSGEDLCNIGPVALLQDLAAAATLGIEHVERNGHHYFAGLGMFPEAVQNAVLTQHNDLYRRHGRGFAALSIKHGRIALGSVIDAPFGVGFELDSRQFTALDECDFSMLT
jgi:hypothetical protein